eukprot:6600962-Pyramimonas_sp.AAC.1
MASQDLKEEDIRIISVAPVPLLGTIVTMEMHKVMENIDMDEKFFLFFKMILATDTKMKIGVGFMASHTDIIFTMQAQVVNSLMDRTWGKKEASAIISIGDSMKKAMDYLPVDIAMLDVKASGPAGMTAHGWHAQVLADLSCLYAATRALCHSELVSHLSCSDRKLYGAFVTHKDKLSHRCKTHFRRIMGSHAAHGKTAWDVLTSFAEANVAGDIVMSKPETFGEFLEPFQKFLDGVDSTFDEDWEDTYNAVCDIHEFTETTVKDFALTF